MSVTAELKRLGSQTLVYGLGTIFVRALSFLMLPLYTRHVSKSDYGIIALATSVGGVLVLLFPLSLHGALNRFLADAKDDPERRGVVATLSIGAALSGLLMAGILDALGEIWAPWLSPDIAYRPYLRMVVWTACFASLGYVPATLLQARERALGYTLVTAFPALATIGFVISEVVVQETGAVGYLRGCLWGAAIGALPGLWVSWSQGGAGLRVDLLRRALAYCLPLVLQGISAWMLTLSDRLILNRFVPLEQVGVYGVAAQIAGIVTIAAWAMNSAWVPYIFRTESQAGFDAPGRIARLATYFAVVVTWAALGVALGGRDLLVVFSAPAYHEAAVVVPLLAAGFWLGALYLVPAGFLFLKSRTGLIPILTALAGALSIGMNVLLVPRQGYVAAGWGALAGQGLHLLLVWRVAQKVFPVPYEYGRLLRVLMAGPAIYLLGRLIPTEPWGPTLAARVALWGLFPLALCLTGFLNVGERAVIASRLKAGRA